jgi:hypothetical protein
MAIKYWRDNIRPVELEQPNWLLRLLAVQRIVNKRVNKKLFVNIN